MRLAAYWDWPLGAPVPDARIVVCAPGIMPIDAAAEPPNHRETWKAFGRERARLTFVVPQTDWSPKEIATAFVPALHVTRQADLARPPGLLGLLKVKAERRALVVSPEEAIDLEAVFYCPQCRGYGVIDSHNNPCIHCDKREPAVDVVFIVGLDKPVHPDWVRSIVDQCQAAGVPVVFVTWGTWAPAAHLAERYPNDPVGARFEHGEWFWRVNAERFGALLDGKPIEDVPAWLGGAG